METTQSADGSMRCERCWLHPDQCPCETPPADYHAYKALVGNAILLWRIGDTWHTWGPDADTARRILGMSTVPDGAELDRAIQKIVRAGHKVALSEPAPQAQ